MTERYVHVSKPLFWDEKNKRVITQRGGSTLKQNSKLMKDAFWLAKRRKREIVRAEKKRLGRQLTHDEMLACLSRATLRK